MKSYHQPYRVYYRAIGKDYELIKFEKTTGIPVFVAHFGMVMCRTASGFKTRWELTDYASGLLIGTIYCYNSSELSKKVKDYMTFTFIPRLVKRPNVVQWLDYARRLAKKMVPLLKKYNAGDMK